MLTIRLQRVGKKNQASFRIVLQEKYRSAKKQVVEVLGHYNPRLKDFAIKDQERLKYWVAQHVEISPTVNNLLVSKGLLQVPKVRAWKPKKKVAPKPAGEGEKAKASPEGPKTDSLEDKKPVEQSATGGLKEVPETKPVAPEQSSTEAAPVSDAK